jgi:hypothetical protein
MRVSQSSPSSLLLWILCTLFAKRSRVNGFVTVPVDRHHRQTCTTTSVNHPTVNNNHGTNFVLHAQLQQEQQHKQQPVQRRKRDWFLRTILRRRSDGGTLRSSNRPIIRNITTLSELEEHWRDEQGLFTIQQSGNGGAPDRPELPKDYNALLRSMNVMGDTQMIGSSVFRNYTHPVVQLLHERSRTGTIMSRAFTPPDTLSKEDIRTIADVRRDIWTNSFTGLCVGTLAGFCVHSLAAMGHRRGTWKLSFLNRNTAFFSVLLGGAVGSFVMSITTGKNEVHNLHPIFQVGARTLENSGDDSAAGGLDHVERERNRLYRRATLTKAMERGGGGLSDSHGGHWVEEAESENESLSNRGSNAGSPSPAS